MEGATIRFSMANILSISLAGALGYAAFTGITMALAKIKMAQGN